MATPEREELLPYEWPGTYFIGEEEMRAAADVLSARSPYRYCGHSPKRYAARLEAAYRERLGRKHALAVNSGTAALCVAMGALGIGPGDEVLLPGYLWCSCFSAIVRAGAIPRLVDCDDTFCMSPEDLERKVGPHSRAVLLVHMSGAPGAVDRITEICRRRGLSLVEDCAQANGARFHGKPVGSFGDIAIFSFQVNKNITAGEGGILVCDDLALHKRAWACHDLGYPRDLEGHIDTSDAAFHLWGQGSRCPELVAAVVCAQLHKLDTITAEMRRRKYLLKEKLAGAPGISFRRILDPEGDSGPFLLSIWKNGETCRQVVERTRAAGVLTGSAGINNIRMSDWGLHLYYKNLSLVEKRSLSAAGRPWTDPLNDFAVDYQYGKGTLPLFDDLVERSSLLSIPPVLSDEAIDRMAHEFHRAASDAQAAAGGRA